MLIIIFRNLEFSCKTGYVQTKTSSTTTSCYTIGDPPLLGHSLLDLFLGKSLPAPVKSTGRGQYTWAVIFWEKLKVGEGFRLGLRLR